MDSTTFDRLTRRFATEQTRRRALASAVAAGAVLFGGSRAGAAPEAEGNKCQGKPCNKNKNCGRGLICNEDTGECEYKRGNKKGKKNDTCCKNNDCKKGLRCDKNKCVRK